MASEPPVEARHGDDLGRPDRCEICQATGVFERYDLREMLFGTREVFRYTRCQGCGVMHIAQVPADLDRHYPPDYYAIGAPAAPRPSAGRLADAASRARDQASLLGIGRLRARLLRRWAEPMSIDVRRAIPFVQRAGLRSFDDPIIDVGCGRVPGNLVALRHLGFRHLLGVDPFLEGPTSVDGIELRRLSIHEVSGTFRLVTMHHSFEHMPDPVDAMASARRLLAPGGTVLVRTPIMDTWFWQTYGTHWWELDPPRHLFVHTLASLDRCAARAGLERIDVLWDSSATEIIASEQIARDIAWREPESWGEKPPAGIDDATIATWRAKVVELNATGRAGRAGVYYRIASRHAQ